MSYDRYDKKLKELFKKVLQDKISLPTLSKELRKFPVNTEKDPQRAINLKILAKSYQVSKNIKIMTWCIAVMTLLNVILVAISVYLQFFL